MLMNSRGGHPFGGCLLLNSRGGHPHLERGSASRDNFYGSIGTNQDCLLLSKVMTIWFPLWHLISQTPYSVVVNLTKLLYFDWLGCLARIRELTKWLRMKVPIWSLI